MLPDDEQIAEIANRDIAPAICPLWVVISTGRRNTWGQLAINNDDGYASFSFKKRIVLNYSGAIMPLILLPAWCPADWMTQLH
jgi:hypothetical protein